MFYKNSQNCKVQSSLFTPENHRSTTQPSLQAEFEESAPGQGSLSAPQSSRVALGVPRQSPYRLVTSCI